MNRKFRFRLQKLLDHRIMRERQEQSRLVQLRMQLQRELAKLEQLLVREQEILELLNRGTRVDVEERWRGQYALERIAREQAAQQLTIDQARVAVEQQEQVVNAARKDVKVLEKLEEKQREAYRVEQLREEQIFLDDIAGQQYIRQASATAGDA